METGTHGSGPFGSGTQGTEEAKEKARELGRTARERAMSTLDRQREQVSGLLDRVADSMQDDRLGAYASDYARRGADLLRRRSADELFESARRGFRSRPGVVLGAAFVAGLALARLMKGAAGGGGERWDERERHGDGRWAGTGYDEGSWSGQDGGAP